MLSEAVAKREIKTAKKLLREGANPNELDALGQFAIHRSAFNTDVAMTKLLLGFRGDPNALTADNRNAMHKTAIGICFSLYIGLEPLICYLSIYGWNP